MRLIMRTVFVLMIGSVLSILAVKYADKSLDMSVPMATPATAADL